VVASAIFAGILAILFGLNPAPQTVPLVQLIREYPVLSLLLGVVLLIVTLGAIPIARAGPGETTSDGDSDPHPHDGWGVPRLLISFGVPSLSTFLSLALVAVVLTRPAWCPTALCPAPRILTNPHAIHDHNLEVYLTAVQSAAYVLPGSPSQYTAGNLPTSIAALRIDQQPQMVYRVVVGIHSLQQGRFGLIIEQLALVVVQVPPTPQPLNVWLASPSLLYSSNPFQVSYLGQLAGSVLPATYLVDPQSYVQLGPGEADDLDLQVDSKVLVDLKFRVQVTYRVTSQSVTHTLTLPQEFEVIYSDTANWHTYEF
jgi:hypothetical protein